MSGLVSVCALLLFALASLISAIVIRRRAQKAMERELGGAKTHRRSCEACGAADVEVSGSSIWCRRCGASG